MGRMKVKCDNKLCLYHTSNGGCCATTVEVCDNTCKSFKPSLNYYIIEFFDAFRDGNFILPMNWNNDVQIGAYFAMHLYGLSFKKCGHGDWEWLQFCANDDENKIPLSSKKIVDMDIDEEKYTFFYNKIINNELPPYYDDEIEHMNKEHDEKEIKEAEIQKKIEAIPDDEVYGKYGLLSPDGKFYVCEFGDHTKLASDLVNAKGLKFEYRNWLENKGNYYKSCLDFLQEVKHFFLIHNPQGGSPYISFSYYTPEQMTKKQKEFLYNYFMKIGNTLYAEQFMKEG